MPVKIYSSFKQHPMISICPFVYRLDQHPEDNLCYVCSLFRGACSRSCLRVKENRLSWCASYIESGVRCYSDVLKVLEEHFRCLLQLYPRDF